MFTRAHGSLPLPEAQASMGTHSPSGRPEHNGCNILNLALRLGSELKLERLLENRNRFAEQS